MSVDETLMCSFKKIKPLDKKKLAAASGKKMGTNFGNKYMTKFTR